MTPLKVMVLGGGVAGLSVTHSLLRRAALTNKSHKFNVTLVDAATSACIDGSSAKNAGLINLTYCKPPGSIHTICKLLGLKNYNSSSSSSSSPFMNDIPEFFDVARHELMNPRMLLWAISLLRQCTYTKYQKNFQHAYELCVSSAEILKNMTDELGCDYNLRKGTLLCMNSANGAVEEMDRLNSEFGSNILSMESIKQEDIPRYQPALSNAVNQGLFQSALMINNDSAADSLAFSRAVEQDCIRLGMETRYNSKVTRIRIPKKQRGVHVELSCGNILTSDIVVVSLGAHTADVLPGIRIYPVKGFSMTIPNVMANDTKGLAFVDLDHSLVVNMHTENRLRITCGASLSGYDTSVSPAIKDWLHRYVGKILSLNSDDATITACHRPLTPTGLPYAGRSSFARDVFIHAGHGQTGWTMAWGTGRKVADQIFDNDILCNTK